ncbi:hypothetical protein N0V93_001052 [Gnomoniopsis smithogilvyi]|uniref:Uncharacterized protein n=1 Tax=Gnomoniopsis smithogilvyi TaxID=1191159 RepID=A0A9W9D2A0_9PEZI|nr:hypothetical protein N0V93_001052 [Gnomoniopsis smithogilvyi]
MSPEAENVKTWNGQQSDTSPEPVRKCHLQLAYECGKTEVPCGKMIEHSYMSLKIDKTCKTCAVKINKAQGTLSRIRDQLAMAKLKLRMPPESLAKGEETGDEALSPVELGLTTTGMGLQKR